MTALIASKNPGSYFLCLHVDLVLSMAGAQSSEALSTLKLLTKT